MRHSTCTTESSVKPSIFAKRCGIVVQCAGALALATSLQGVAKADSSSTIYRGHDLGFSLRKAISQLQVTGASQAARMKLGISGSGDQLMFTEVSVETIETETASYKDLDFDAADVHQIGGIEGRYGVTLHASGASVNDHIVGLSSGKSAVPDRDAALSYMDFWLMDPGLTRVRHLADLIATVGARLHEQTEPGASTALVAGAGDAAAALTVTPVRAMSEHIEDSTADMPKASLVQPAPRVPVDIVAAPEDDGSSPDPALHGKCLLPTAKKTRHGKAHVQAAAWSTLKQGTVSGGGRLFYKVSALHGTDDHQNIQFFLGNTLPVAATVVARVIITSSDGGQKAEDIGLNQIGGRATKTDDSLLVTPFEDDSCISNVEVTEIHACPLPDDNDTRDDSVDIYRCNADAAAGTTIINGVTYIAGREPKSLVPPAQVEAASFTTSARRAN